MTRRWVIRAGLLAALVVGTGAACWTLGMLAPRPSSAVTLALLLCAVAATWWTSRDLPRPADPASWYVLRRDDASAPPALDYRLVRLRRDLRDTVQSQDHGDAVYPLIRGLAAHRLLTAHGVDLDADPTRAQEHLPPALRDYLASSDTAAQRRSMARISAAVAGIEQM